MLLLPALAVLAVFFVAPAVSNVVLAFQDVTLFQLGVGGAWVGLANFVSVLTDDLTALALRNTVLLLTAGTVLPRLALGLGLALLLNARVIRRWRLAGLSRALLIIPWATPPVVAVAAWKWLLHPRFGVANQIAVELGVLDQGIPWLLQTSTVWLGIIATVTWQGLPFVAISMLAGLQAIPREVYEAAQVDGASGWQTLRHVTLPLLAPVTVVIALLTTIWTYNNFVYVWLLTGGGPGDYTQVLATQLYTEAFVNYDFGKGAAIGVLMTAIMVLFSVVYFRFVVSARVRPS